MFFSKYNQRWNKDIGKYLAINKWITINSVLIWLIAMCENTRVDLSAGILGNEALYYLHSLSGSMLVIWLCKRLPTNLRLLRWIGKNTLGFLVTHVFVRHAIIALQEKILGYYFDGWLLAIPMVLLSAVAVWFVGHIFPEVFGQKRLKKGVQ